MKETKKFFSNNRLNKGYRKISNIQWSDSSTTRKKYQHILPPIDIMEQYEEFNPGTFKKLFDMAEKEQNHRHLMDLLVTKKYARAKFWGRISALIFVIIISITTFMLAAFESTFLSCVFAVSAFACIMILSYFYSKKPTCKKSNYKRSVNSQYSNSYRSDKSNRSSR